MPKTNNLFNALAATIIIVLVVVLVGCNVAKPQKGGEAGFKGSPSGPIITVEQGENSQTESTTTYERKIVPIMKSVVMSPIAVTNSDSTVSLVAIDEKYTQILGAHQKDDARAGYTGVQKTAAILKAQSPIMYAGIALIVVALAMSYFQAKFPLVFTPGLKLIALTFLTGLCLMILPTMTQDKTVLTMALLAGTGIVVVYILTKKFSQESTVASTTETAQNENENQNQN